MNVNAFTDYKKKIIDSCSTVIVGKDDIIELVLTCFICSGHVLLEDLPGTGKTMLLRSFANAIGGEFKRIQFTPDLLPSDLTGINFYNRKTGEFEFRKGPLFANIVLADEINRATPRTQSSLLEAMGERQITVDGVTMALEEPFMVMATQNPIESYGTFPLPEAQTDRFFMRLSLGYMTKEQEAQVISRPSTEKLVNAIHQAATDEETKYVREHYQDVEVCGDVRNYMMEIITKTRNRPDILAGVSTRGGIALYKASQVTAAMNGRAFVLPEDVKRVAPHVLGHRITLAGVLNAAEAEDKIRRLVDEVEVPME